MKIEGGRVNILKKCTEFVIRVIKAHHIPALSDDQSLNLCVKIKHQDMKYSIYNFSKTSIFLSNPELKYLFRPKDGE